MKQSSIKTINPAEKVQEPSFDSTTKTLTMDTRPVMRPKSAMTRNAKSRDRIIISQTATASQWTQINHKLDTTAIDGQRVKREHELDKFKIGKLEQKVEAYEDYLDQQRKALDERFVT